MRDGSGKMVQAHLVQAEHDQDAWIDNPERLKRRVF